jgi:hypothetical protein
MLPLLHTRRARSSCTAMEYQRAWSWSMTKIVLFGRRISDRACCGAARHVHHQKKRQHTALAYKIL